METSGMDHDPGKWGYSLANLAPILLPCLDAVAADRVLEIGAYKGELTEVLLDWAAGRGASVAVVEPAPTEELAGLAGRYPELEVIATTSHAALAEVELPPALIIDGDHNYWTLTEELRIVAERRPGVELPLIALHDVGWPHARRDTYYEPERVPAEHRQPLVEDAVLAPGEPGVSEHGLRYPWAAAREGGPRNGVLTAAEDFAAGRAGIRLAVVPVFFGLGLLWHTDAPFAAAVEQIVAPWDRNPLLQRLEENRVAHLIGEHVWAGRLDARERRGEEQERLLRTLLESGAFVLAERISRLRHGGKPAFSRKQVRRALGDDPD
jgi:hypothetical protein